MNTVSHESRGVRDRVCAVLADVLGLDASTLQERVDIREDLVPDSLDQLSMFMALEDEFGATMPEEDTERLRTLGDVVAYIEERVQASGAE